MSLLWDNLPYYDNESGDDHYVHVCAVTAALSALCHVHSLWCVLRQSTAVLQTGDAGVAARSPAMKVQGEELEVSHAVLVTVAGAAQPHHKRHTVTEDEGSATLKGGAGITPMFAPHRLSAR